MSWLSQATGIHVSPHGVSLSRPDPIGVAKTALTNPLFDTALAVGLPGVGSLLGSAGSAIGGAVSSIPGLSSLGGLLGGAGGALGEGAAGTGLGGIADAAAGGGGGGIASSIEGLLGGAGKQLLGNGGLNLLGIAQGLNATNLGKKSNDYTNAAINSAQNAYNEKSGIRQQALAGLQNPTPPNLSNLSNIASALPQAPANYAGSATTADPSKLQPLAFAGTQQGGQGAAPAMSLAQLQQLLNSGKRFS